MIHNPSPHVPATQPAKKKIDKKSRGFKKETAWPVGELKQVRVKTNRCFQCWRLRRRARRYGEK